MNNASPSTQTSEIATATIQQATHLASPSMERTNNEVVDHAPQPHVTNLVRNGQRSPPRVIPGSIKKQKVEEGKVSNYYAPLDENALLIRSWFKDTTTKLSRSPMNKDVVHGLARALFTGYALADLRPTPVSDDPIPDDSEKKGPAQRFAKETGQNGPAPKKSSSSSRRVRNATDRKSVV